MSPRAKRELGVAVVLCLLGSGLVLLAAGRPWAQVQVAATGLFEARTAEVSGGQLAPGASALGLVGLAGVVALAATRRWGRVVVGVLLLAVGAAVAVLVARTLGSLTSRALAVDGVRAVGAAPADVGATAWPVVALLGAALLALSGVLVGVRGPRWAGLSRRYESPVAAPADDVPAPTPGPVTERSLWEALDRGDDPTARERADGRPADDEPAGGR